MNKHTIRNSYDAYWFLYGHPKLNCREGKLLETVQDIREARKWCKEKYGGRIIIIKDQATWAKKKVRKLYEFAWKQHAIEANLYIFYAKVNEHYRVDDDPSKNVLTEVWLEFGPIVHYLHDGQYQLAGTHDIKLDCGGPTFDAALVKLARLVKRHYGDYVREDD